MRNISPLVLFFSLEVIIIMKRSVGFIIAAAALTANVFSQTGLAQKPAVVAKVDTPIAAATSPMDIAKAAIAAHGGEKFKQMKSLLVGGSVDIAGSPTYVIPATFRFITAGDKYLFELTSPIQSLKQAYDGKQTYSSGYELPPMTSLGFPLLVRAGDTGYVVAALPEAKKKKKGFRMTTPDGFYTDFFVDEKSGQIKGYESSYDVNGQLATTSVAIDEYQTVEGVTLPKKYSQRFDLGSMTAYANFNTKQILVNSPISDDVFTLTK
jgi:hypothetical protein